VISDLNQAYGSTTYDPEVDQAVALMEFWQPDLVVCGGDMVAGQSLSLSTPELQAMWGAFDDHVAAPLRRMGIPFGFTLGNHDGSGAVGEGGGYVFQNDRDVAAAYWRNPAHDPGLEFVDRTHFPFYYSFQVRSPQVNGFFLVWDGSTAEIPPEQRAWVEKSLASPPATQAQVRILLGHLPLYGIAEGRNKPGEVLEGGDALGAWLERQGVHAYISGHHHAYYPAHREDLQLLHAGLAGSGPRRLVGQDSPSPKTVTVMDITYGGGGSSPGSQPANPEDPRSPDRAQPQITYSTYALPSLEPVTLEDLPRFVLGYTGRVLRQDVPRSALTPQEQDICVAQLGSQACP